MSSFAPADISPEAAHLDEVADGVFGYVQPDGTWWINNCGVIAGTDRTVLIDTCGTERRTRHLLETVRARTGTRVSTLINTHHHGDHTHGNYLVDQAVIVGHDKCRELIVDHGITKYEGLFDVEEWGDLRARPPDLTFRDSLTLYIGDLRAELYYAGTAAHTTNDIVVWLPEHSVLFSGDLVFNGGTPFAIMGSIAGSRTAMEFLRGFGAATIIPGHGNICGPEHIEKVDGYFDFIQQTATAAHSAGLTPLQAAREADLGVFGELSDSERLVANLHRAYAEIDGLPPGGELDIRPAIADMIAWNDGQPIRCFV
ncbi:MAG: MBL fold metallo-hydrolase [Nocardioidaceae bacterium]